MTSHTIYVFSGPTIGRAAIQAELDATCLPPAAGGDVYRAARNHPAAIGLIDGEYGKVPSVWHKEILWAMAEGIHVFGAAGIGALRAAELAPFGMEGVGVIFEAYLDGMIEDDDEVVLAHTGPKNGYLPLSEPMVNVRATLAAGERAGLVPAAVRATVELAAKEIFYPDRTYALILERVAGRDVAPELIEKLSAWLPNNRVDQQHADAMAMLHLMRDRQPGLPRKEVRYSLERTDYWDRIERLAPAEPLG